MLTNIRASPAVSLILRLNEAFKTPSFNLRPVEGKILQRDVLTQVLKAYVVKCQPIIIIVERKRYDFLTGIGVCTTFQLKTKVLF